MVRFLTAVLLFASFHVVADDLKTFSTGQVIDADDFNHNFQKLEQDISEIPAGLKGDKGDKGDTGDKGDKGDNGNPGEPGNDGQNGNDGADGVAAGLSCSTDQVIVYRGGAWVCSSLEKTSDFFGGDDYIGSVDCPLGKKVTGGGCAFDKKSGGFCSREISKPLDNLEGWYCRTFGSGGCFVYEVWAICL